MPAVNELWTSLVFRDGKQEWTSNVVIKCLIKRNYSSENNLHTKVSDVHNSIHIVSLDTVVSLRDVAVTSNGTNIPAGH